MQETEIRESPTGNSFMSAFTECPKKWAFKYLMQWVPDDSKTARDYLVFGQAFHLYKEWFYLNKEEASQNYLTGVPASLEYIEKFKNTFSDEIISELKERLQIAVDIWVKEYGLKEHDKYEVIGVEMLNILTLPNNFKLSVRYDAILKDKETGFVYIFDTKTTRASLVDTIEKYRYGPQPFIYCASIMRSDFPWKNDFRGWITDVIFQRKYVREGWRTEVKRSEAVFYTEQEITELMKSYTLLTDEMLFCTDRFLNDKKPLGESFRMDRSKCYLKYQGLCPYYYDCLKNWTSKDVGKPPVGYSADNWTGTQIIQNNLSGIFQNETTFNKGLDCKDSKI